MGTASAAAWRRMARNGRSSRAAGFEALTSGSRSSRAARRLTNVVLARRRKSGSREIASARRSLRSPIAFIIELRFPTRRRDVGGALGERPGELRGVDDQVLEGALVGVELAEDPPRGREERVQVLQAAVCLRADALVGELEALDHVLEVLDRLRREGVEELVEVDGRDRLRLAQGAAVGDLRPGGVVGGQGELDLAPGDLRERGRAHRRHRAAGQRRVVLARR